ncbi:hypothetical protein B484DRAFT_477107 [Ochromonadaceae sp. CCMP2298]|nr:hypothetical protein B484DRAFT_446908 [Ochromonadaceae sp. CCMP2298]KAJ1438584.1 hypothetical protein B484DRAFT_477107 [Ochromonadaceae sp. CCMP2298]
MEAFVLKTLRRLKKESPRRFKELRDVCDEMIATLTEKDKAADKESRTDADQYFEPLEMACQTRQPRLMEISLDAIHFLIEHGFLKGKRVVTSRRPVDASQDTEGESKPVPLMALTDLIIETVSNCSDETDDGVQLQVIKALLTAITSTHCLVHEASLLLSVRACFHIHLISKNLINKTTAKAALTQIISVTNQRMEVHSATSSSAGLSPLSNDAGKSASVEVASFSPTPSSETDKTETQDEPAPTTAASNMVFPSVYHKDSYLLFRALCKLSMKGLSEETQYSNSDAIPLQNKVLSLELILHILNNTGPVFRNEEKFVYAVRTYLCVSLLSNCTSHVAQVAGLSLQIFLVLMQQFKDHLKHEVEVFVSNIFLRMLESENSTYEHKHRVLQVFQSICKDPKSLVELFMNYDCDLDAINLFSRIVNGLAKIAKNPSLLSTASRDFMSNTNKKALSEDHHTRTLGLECLGSILQSLEVSAGMREGNGDSAIVDEASLPGQPDSVSPEEAPAEDEGLKDAGPSPNNIVDVYDKKQKLSEELETGILKFNLSPKTGLAFLAKAGHIQMDARSVAEFFHQYQDRLDKTAMGEYLGREREYMDGFCLKVLHEYVEVLDFADMPFDLAIRYFLAGFRLPGEAQKIDRIMEKFAERYYLQNREVFASADMAFILAFSTIMLQTNLHNPAIRDDKRMTKEQFLKQNKGISADGELPEDLLMEIYDRIAAQPISITSEAKETRKAKKDEPASFVIFQATTEKMKKDAFNVERKEMVRAGEAMIKLSAKRSSTVFVRSNESDEAYARSMFEIVWPPMIGVLSQLLETYDDDVMVSLCLECFRHSILSACRLDLPTARNTFVNALLKFTTLDAVKEMKAKNVACIKLTMDIALSEGDYLEECWLQILLGVSRLARLQLLASGSLTDDIFFSDTDTDGKRHSGGIAVTDPFTKLFLGASRAELNRQLEETNAEMVVRVVDSVLVDRLFAHSVHLSGPSVKHFVASLCEVSMLELTTSSTMNSLRGKDSAMDSAAPRVFSLQKLVEVADGNMSIRARFDWSSIWSLLAKHFSLVGLHDNHNVAMYAIDSLKQLSVKFLQKDELSNFNFQRVFLNPFEKIMASTDSQDTMELVLNCIEVMIRSCAGNIHSGWRSIFTIFSTAAAKTLPNIASNAFSIIQQLMTTQFHLLIFDFVELMNCLVCFASSQHTNLALRALDHLSTCSDHLSAGLIDPTIHVQNPSSDAMGISWEKSNTKIESIDDSAVFTLWWPLLLGLSTSVADNRLKVRNKALEILQSVLCRHGNIFSPQTMSVIFKGVLFPIIDSAKTDSTQQVRSAWPTENPASEDAGWIGTMGSKVLMLYVELFKMFRSNEASLFPEVLAALQGCIMQDTESLARLGVSAMMALVLSLASDEVGVASRLEADLVCERVADTMASSLCLDFGGAGRVVMQQDYLPAHVQALLQRCPLTRRRRLKLGLPDESEDAHADRVMLVGETVRTPFGVGHVAEPSESGSRSHIALPWGSLYASVSFPQVRDVEQDAAEDRLHDLPWSQIASSAMTSMVVTLDLVQLTKELLVSPAYHWTIGNYERLLYSLEAVHWHAYCFNESNSLQLQLQQRGFMTKDSAEVPHLLDQEVQSLEQLLFTVFRLYCHDKHSTPQSGTGVHGSASVAFAEPWVERLSSLVLTRYVTHSESIIKKSIAKGEEEEEEEDDDDTVSSGEAPAGLAGGAELHQLRHAAYKSPALIVLEGMLDLTHEQFQTNKSWVVPLLTRVIICDDIEVRSCVRQIFQSFVTFLLMN